MSWTSTRPTPVTCRRTARAATGEAKLANNHGVAAPSPTGVGDDATGRQWPPGSCRSMVTAPLSPLLGRAPPNDTWATATGAVHDQVTEAEVPSLVTDRYCPGWSL